MWYHQFRIITLLALLAVTSACDDSAQEAPPPPDGGLSINLINAQPKVVTVVVPVGTVGKSEIPEAKIFSATITNDQIPAELKTETADSPPVEVLPDAKGSTAKLSLNVPPPTKDEPTPKPDLDNPSETTPIPAKTIDATGAYRVDAAFGLQRSLPSGYTLTAITPHQEHVVSGGGLSSMTADRMVLLAPGKKLADGIAMLKNRKMSADKTVYSDGAVLFYEQSTAKETGKWKLRTLAGEESVLDLGAVDPASAGVADHRNGYFLLEFGSDKDTGYLLIKAADKSITTICAKSCASAQLLSHPTDGVFVLYRDVAADNRPLMLVSADAQKQFAIAADPAMGVGEQLKAIVYREPRFIPSGAFVYGRELEKITTADNAAGPNTIRTTTHNLFNLSDSSQRVIFESTDPIKESLVEAPSVQRTLTQIIAVSGDRVLAEMADKLWSFQQPAKPVTDHLTWIAADGTKTDIVSTEVTLRVLKYWPETNRVALQIDEAAPAIKIVKADSGQEETVLKKAIGQYYVTGTEFWPFIIFDNREGLSDDEHKLEILGPYLDRVELGAVEGGNIAIRLTDFATDAAPTRVADETVVPQLTLEVPAEVSAVPGETTVTVQVIGATPFDEVSGEITCDNGATPAPANFKGGSDVNQEVTVTFANPPATATCTVTATDGLKTATATVVVKYVKKDEASLAVEAKNFNFASGLYIQKVSKNGKMQGLVVLDPTKFGFKNNIYVPSNLPYLQGGDAGFFPKVVCTASDGAILDNNTGATKVPVNEWQIRIWYSP